MFSSGQVCILLLIRVVVEVQAEIRSMCVNFCAICLRTTLVLIAVQYVFSEKTVTASVEELQGGEGVLDVVVDVLGRELSNSSFSEVVDFWSDVAEGEARSLQESPNNITVTFQSKKQPKFGSTSGGGSHGGNGGGKKKRRGQKKQQGLVQRILPIMFIPFMISTAIIPLMIFVIKVLFIKAAIVAKVAVTLGIISFFKRRTNEARKKNRESLISRLLPLLVMPFMMSTMMLPMMLTQMKVMLLKAIFLGKLAIIFATFNILRNMGNTSGLYSHNVHLRRPVGHVMEDPELSKGHYGYTGDEEYGAYLNRKK